MRKALGRGLDALLPQKSVEISTEPTDSGTPLKVPLSKIRPNHLQPRRHFDPEKLSELASSIKTHGLAQPIVVSRDGDGTFELIAGERRMRACELAGLTEVEVFIRQPATDQDRMALTLVENLQREDLNAIETALGYQRLIKEFGLDQDQISGLVGKSKPTISNTMRLLRLPEEIQKAVQIGQLQEGHARALLMVEDPIKRHELFLLAIKQDLSVRQIEELARSSSPDNPEPEKKALRQKDKKSADIRELEDALQRRLGTRVTIRTGKDATKGMLVIHFFSPEDFERVVGIINK